MSARCRRRRRRTPASSTARCAPAWESVAFKKVDVADRREGLLRERQGRARARLTRGARPWPRRPSAIAHCDGRRRRGVARPCGRAVRRAWRRNARGLSVPDALADRLLRPDARADARLALSLLHRLRPADAAALGRARELRIRLLPGPAARQRAVGHLPLRALVGAAEARRRARRSPWRSTAACAASASTARSSTCRRCSARRSPSPCSGGRFSAPTGWSTSFSSLTLGINGPGWVTHPDYALWTLVVLAIWQFGSPMIIFLAGLRQIPQDLYEAASMDGAGPVRQFCPHHAAAAGAGDLLQPRLPDDRGASRPSRRPSSSRAATAGRSTRRSSTRSTSTSRRSRISAWATPRRSPGCCSSSSASSPRSPS